MIRRILEGIGHPQNPTNIKTDNSTTHDFVHSSMRNKRSKAWDMRYHWLRQEYMKKMLTIEWDKGKNNKADYFTKHHSPAHHKATRLQYVLKGFSMTKVCVDFLRNSQQGCVDP